MHRKVDLGLELAAAKEPHTVLGAAQNPGLDQGRGVDLARRIEPAGIDRLLQAPEIDLVELERELRVAKAALGQAAMERHLAALETLDAHARTRGLALAATAAGLAFARADAAADALSDFVRTGAVGEFVKLHRNYSTTRTRCATLAIMPRVAGVSTSSATRPILLSLRP